MSKPTGISTGEATVLARVSIATTTAPPPTADAGMSHRWVGPIHLRITSGTINPTNPMAPPSPTAPPTASPDPDQDHA